MSANGKRPKATDWAVHPRTYSRLFRGIVLLLVLFGAAFSLRAEDRDVVINEIMYHPPGDSDGLQYIELLNRGGTEVNLSKWSFTKGVKYTFPDGTKLAPHGFLVVCHDLSAFSAYYGRNVRSLGNFSGKLSHKGVRLELSNSQGNAVESVKYSDHDGWPRGADGYSSSLERICPFADGQEPGSWAASALPATKRAAGTPGRQNDNYAAKLPPIISRVEFSPKSPSPQQRVKVTAAVADSDGVKTVSLVYRVATTGRESEDNTIPMSRVSGDEKRGVYEAAIEGQTQGRLIRFRIKAAGSSGSERLEPSSNEPHRSYSYYCLNTPGKATVPVGYVVNVGPIKRGPGHYQMRRSAQADEPSATRGNGAFIYIPADGGAVEVFDYVQVVTRSGGYKVHFQKDHPLKGMTAINLIFEDSPRWILSEPLSYALYRMAGVPAELTEHVRLSIDGRLLGYYLLIEQPNRSFLARNGRDESGNLYKLIWYEQGIVRQNEKKNNLSTGHDDLVQLIEGLRRKSGAAQWEFIEQHFDVEEFVNYYAVNMCIQNWDGFFNNYFTYHNPRTDKWEIYPWDEDKTWGDYDGASSRYDWYEMPLTFGMNGDRPQQDMRRFGGGPFGGASWWRPPNYLSGPLLANPQFRKQFLIRLRELCRTVFTEENFNPIIDAMEKRLQPEVRIRAQSIGEDPQRALRQFASDMQSFRAQVHNRRKFILAELEKLPR